jgi:flagellar motility protein MotE (MotC chaperone)
VRNIRPTNCKPAEKVRRTALRYPWLVVLAGSLILALPDISFGSEAESTTPEVPKAAAPAAVQMPADDYCANISDLAADARYVLQKKTLEDLQRKIDEKITLLEAKRAQSEEFLKKRDEAVQQTQKGLVDIFSKMKPDVAAAQFEILDVATSASILKQLNARVASTILNEMKAPVAAAITVKMAEPVTSANSGGGT